MTRTILVPLFNILLLIYTAKAQYFVPVPNGPEFPFNFSSSKSATCRQHSELLVSSLKNGTLWAYNMWDSSAKAALGLTEGNTYDLGYYDECMDINEPFPTQYCLATIHLKIILNHTIADPFSLQYKPYESVYDTLYYAGDPNKIPRDRIHWGLCMPASCSTIDVQNALQVYLDTQRNSHIERYEVELKTKDCQIKETSIDLSILNISFCMVIIGLISLVSICTMFDYKYIEGTNQSTKTVKLLQCFSARQNIRDLMKPDSSNNALMVLYFIRCMLTWAVTAGHAYLNTLIGAVFNVKDIELKNRSFTYMYMTRGDVSIDAFFLLSGLLVTYSYLVQSEKRSVNPFKTIILRYFRLVPLFALVTFFYAAIFYKLGSGPLWNEIIGKEKDYCQKTWWTNLLLINNYINVENMCVLQGWYLAVDFHLIIMSIPLNYLIKKNTRCCWSIFTFILCISIVIPFLITYLGNKDPIPYIFYNYFSIIRNNDVYQTMYVTTYTRTSPYIIGMAFGFLYYKMKDSKFKLSAVSSFLLLSVSSTLAQACIYSGLVFYQTDYKPSLLEGALYAAFHRPGFVLLIGIFTFTFSYGTVPILGKFVRWSPFIIFSKLSFGTYMVHMIFQIRRAASQKISKPVTNMEWFGNVIFEIAASQLLAFILYLLVEIPIYKLIKELTSTDTHNNVETKKSESTYVNTEEVVL